MLSSLSRRNTMAGLQHNISPGCRYFLQLCSIEIRICDATKPNILQVLPRDVVEHVAVIGLQAQLTSMVS